MAHGGEQPQQKRRRYTDNVEPNPLMISTDKGSKKLPSTTTDSFLADQGEPPPMRNTTAIVRSGENSLGTTTRMMTTMNGSQPPSTAIPSRRQGGATRNLPPRSRPTIAIPQEETKTRKNVHWLLPVGIGMMAMLVLWVTGSWVLAWGIQRYNDVRYGNPRTFHVDSVVGHGGDSAVHPSHFIAMNLNRQAIVIELMAGDPAKSVSYVAPIYIGGDGGDLAPVTVDFRDVNGDKKPDMLIHTHLPTQDQVSVFINEGTRFRPSTGNDKYRI